MHSFANLGSDITTLGPLKDGTVVSIGGTAGTGYVLVSGIDWGDHFEQYGMKHVTGQWLLNALDFKYRRGPVPPVPDPVSESAFPVLSGVGLTALIVSAQRRRQVGELHIRYLPAIRRKAGVSRNDPDHIRDTRPINRLVIDHLQSFNAAPETGATGESTRLVTGYGSLYPASQ